MFTREQFAERLRKVRAVQGKTQGEVAQALGVSTHWISGMERGRRTTATERLAQICDYRRISAGYLPMRKDECI
jgi:transcriptional regulator with XRE-family HTH domain